MQRIDLMGGHPAAPPKDTQCLVFWIKVDVKESANPYGGDFKSLIHSLIICHFDSKVAKSVKAMPIFQVRIEDVKSFDKGLLCKLGGQVGLVKALCLKFDKSREAFQKPKTVEVPKPKTVEVPQQKPQEAAEVKGIF
jgi:hypothetical protein